eukprot:352988-Chlamydomonas_euryale.AAC.6
MWYRHLRMLNMWPEGRSFDGSVWPIFKHRLVAPAGCQECCMSVSTFILAWTLQPPRYGDGLLCTQRCLSHALAEAEPSRVVIPHTHTPPCVLRANYTQGLPLQGGGHQAPEGYVGGTKLATFYKNTCGDISTRIDAGIVGGSIGGYLHTYYHTVHTSTMGKPMRSRHSRTEGTAQSGQSQSQRGTGSEPAKGMPVLTALQASKTAGIKQPAGCRHEGHATAHGPEPPHMYVHTSVQLQLKCDSPVRVLGVRLSETETCVCLGLLLVLASSLTLSFYAVRAGGVSTLWALFIFLHQRNVYDSELKERKRSELLSQSVDVLRLLGL